MIRAARRRRRFSQRELAQRAGVPASTVARLEAGSASPRLDTFVRLMEATGVAVLPVSRGGQVLVPDDEHDAIRDAGDRRFPAHLRWGGRPKYMDGPNWWGWHCIAWYDDPTNVPDHVYWHRPKRGDRNAPGYSTWGDAT